MYAWVRILVCSQKSFAFLVFLFLLRVNNRTWIKWRYINHCLIIMFQNCKNRRHDNARIWWLSIYTVGCFTISRSSTAWYLLNRILTNNDIAGEGVFIKHWIRRFLHILFGIYLTNIKSSFKIKTKYKMFSNISWFGFNFVYLLHVKAKYFSRSTIIKIAWQQ